MKTILLLCLFTALSVLDLAAADPCPLCGGELTTVGSVQDDPSKPNKNNRVWRTGSGLPLFIDDSPICKQCWFAATTQSRKFWLLGNEDPNAFFFPLSAAIRKFPTPPGYVSWEQRFMDGKRIDGLFFTGDHSPELIAKFRAYCTEHKLEIRVIGFKKDVGIWVETPEAQQAGADQPATASDSKSEGKERPKPDSEVRPR